MHMPSKNYAALEKALESDAVAQIQVLDAKSAMEQARASVANATAALQSARTTLGYCTVRAPFDGDMSVGEYSEGAYIAGRARRRNLLQSTTTLCSMPSFISTMRRIFALSPMRTAGRK